MARGKKKATTEEAPAEPVEAGEEKTSTQIKAAKATPSGLGKDPGKVEREPEIKPMTNGTVRVDN